MFRGTDQAYDGVRALDYAKWLMTRSAIPHMTICSGRPQGIAPFVAGDRKGSPLQMGYLGGRRGFASTKSPRVSCTGNFHGRPAISVWRVTRG
jgi:hypothetical protein